jgi:glyoxylase-like metal-dependent hydrolase (beta-lactamase superfamily II)
VDDWLLDYETREIHGVSVAVVACPGVSTGAVSLVIPHAGKRLAFVGELIQAPGKVARLAPLQYDYNDYQGAKALYFSCGRMLREHPDLLLPSMGAPIAQPLPALSELRQNLRGLSRVQAALMPAFDQIDLCETGDDDLVEFIPGRLYRSRFSNAATNFLISQSGKVLSLDYGYLNLGMMPLKYAFATRRPLLHGIEGLKRLGCNRIDACLISHFHDDHVNGVNLIRRVFGTEIMACENFADILEHPLAYDRPCLWEDPILVDRRLPAGKTVTWEDFQITCYPMSGHTRFAALLCIEFDDVRLVHTGDQVFFSGGGDMTFDSPACQLFTNHVYKNGLDLGCYRASTAVICQFAPNWIATGHTDPYRVTAGFLETLEAGAAAFDEVHETLMPLAPDASHFGAESQAAKLTPYHCHQAEGGRIAMRGWVLNPLPVDAKAELTVAAPAGWSVDLQTLMMGPRQQVAFDFSLRVPEGTRCRRTPIALELTVNGRPFGQVAEALVSIGTPMF